MLVAAAVCPCPPLLVPAVAAGAASELDGVRTACADAIAVLAAARPDKLIVVGPAEQGGRGPHPQGTVGGFDGFGVDLRVQLGEGEPRGALPGSLAVAAWLLQRERWAGAVEGLGVGEPLAPERCFEVGADLAGQAERVALLVMGDGSARRSLKAPGYLDERAEAFDAAAARALGAADVSALKELDAELAQELQAAGRAAWQLLAGAAEGAGLSGTLLYDEAPYGVGYMVAAWS
ncbi:class III extradiol dioxygenase subunit B-like domain-containing protein [Streptomyces sp. KLOTTS4A1]|uniref:class III extradiol dioxygenase subunit B-like domain-containing protein n=1 Tax=Streptomyces sp. KLOTTS4A1 TaxID=3390996 RepID=UPI0039F5F85C